MSQEQNNKRIAKNTLLLYIRMVFLMLISLYTSRVVLAALGVVDYGIYNVVGGVVSMFTMISGALNASISRYITFALGTKDLDNIKRTFSSSVTIQLVLIGVFVIIAETIGLWFLNQKMVIDADRMFAANCVYQFSILTFAINLWSVPYNATIIAHEKMSAFAYISIFEGIAKLIVAWSIVRSPIDKLILYAFFLAIISIIVRLVYGFYCKYKFKECSYQFYYNHTLFREMFSFAGWNMIGATSVVLRDHGGNILINVFFGTTLNAARGIAMQVSTAIQGFVANFQTAISPQITKSYVSGNKDYMMSLIFQGSRFSLYILLIIALPFYINAEYFLTIWLTAVPAHTASFLRLTILFSLCESLSGPLMTAMYATGVVRKYQIVVGGMQLLNLPVSYMCLLCGFSAESVIVVSIVISLVCLLCRLIMLKPLIGLSPLLFIKEVVLNTFVVSIISFIPSLFITSYIRVSFISLVLSCVCCLIYTLLIIMFVGCKYHERTILYKKINDIKTQLSSKIEWIKS